MVKVTLKLTCGFTCKLSIEGGKSKINVTEATGKKLVSRCEIITGGDALAQ